MRDYGTKRVEPAWIGPFRRFAPTVLVLCTVLLISILLFFPRDILSREQAAILKGILLVLTYMALLALGAYLFVTAHEQETEARGHLRSTLELSGLSERLTTTLHSIGDGVIATDVDGEITLMNEVALQLTGWSERSALGRPSSDIFNVVNETSMLPEPDPARQVLASGRHIREQLHAMLISRDGSQRPIAYRAAPILDADNWMMGAVIVFDDVTELREVQRQREQLIGELSQANDKLRDEVKKSEQARRAALSLMQDAQIAQAALGESEQRLRVLFEGIDDALFVHDDSGRILDCNPAACARLGYSRNELLSLSKADLGTAADGREPWVSLRTKDGLAFAVDVHASVIKYRGRDARLIVARDISQLLKIQEELKASNDQLRESNAALEEYARVASHDLQEPLRKIESFAQVLLEDYGPKFDTQGRGYLDIMVDSARRMRKLIRDVLAFSRAGMAEQPLAPVDLNQVLKAVEYNLSARIQERGAELAVEPLPTVQADETQMIQLFQNLIGNGIKFNDKTPPRIEVAAVEERNEWRIRIKDNGIGMRPDETSMLFAPFKRLHSRQKYEGSGIGLAICRRIVTRHGGTIGLTSEPGAGSTFWLTLPKVASPLAQEAETRNAKT